MDEFEPQAGTTSSAVISADQLFRYSLTRQWGSDPKAVFVMCNPSTADHAQDDPTIRRCIGFARSWGCGGIEVVNIYAYRATNPKRLKEAGWPVGELNDRFIQAAVAVAPWDDAPIVAAWGAHPQPSRVKEVLKLTEGTPWKCLGLTKVDKVPRHPLFVGSGVKLQPLGEHTPALGTTSSTPARSPK